VFVDEISDEDCDKDRDRKVRSVHEFGIILPTDHFAQPVSGKIIDGQNHLVTASFNFTAPLQAFFVLARATRTLRESIQFYAVKSITPANPVIAKRSGSNQDLPPSPSPPTRSGDASVCPRRHSPDARQAAGQQHARGPGLRPGRRGGQ
jgi:hypothetical protein